MLSTHGFASMVKVDQVNPEQLEGIDQAVLGSPMRGFTPSIPIFAPLD